MFFWLRLPVQVKVLELWYQTVLTIPTLWLCMIYKGENFDITSGFRKACGQEVYLFSPYDEEGKTHRYNPLDYVSEDPAERLGDIDAIGQALYAGENNNDKFWSENAKDFFRGVALFVLESPELPNTLGEILRQASGKGKPVKEHLLEKLKEAQEKGHPYSNNCVDALNRVLSNSENTLASIVATFNTALFKFSESKGGFGYKRK